MRSGAENQIDYKMGLLQVFVTVLQILPPQFFSTYLSLILLDGYACVNFEGLQICPHFADFEFTNWNKDGKVFKINVCICSGLCVHILNLVQVSVLCVEVEAAVGTFLKEKNWN